jgi:general secretion pathway protein C
MAARWTAWIVWAALAASLVFWGTRLLARPSPLPAQAQTVAADSGVQADLLRLFAVAAPSDGGATSAPQDRALAERFRLLGVAAGLQESQRGWALIAVDGQAARAYRRGEAVDGEWILQTVTQNQVGIGPRGGQPVVQLDLPSLPPPATGSLPGAESAAASGGATGAATGAGMGGRPPLVGSAATAAAAAAMPGANSLPPQITRGRLGAVMSPRAVGQVPDDAGQPPGAQPVTPPDLASPAGNAEPR